MTGKWGGATIRGKPESVRGQTFEEDRKVGESLGEDRKWSGTSFHNWKAKRKTTRGSFSLKAWGGRGGSFASCIFCFIDDLYFSLSLLYCTTTE